MNVLLITGPYPPEIRAISFMMKELAEELAARGHDVTVATCWPQYNLSSGAKHAAFSTFTVENKIKVIRVKTLPLHKRSFLIRGLAQISLPYLFLRMIRKFIKQKIDIVIVYTPYLPLGILGIKIKKIYGARFILNVQDIFPQNAIDLGIMKNKLIIKFFERMEKKIYENADKITAYTVNSRRFLIEKKGVPEEKITTVYNWIDFVVFNKAKATGAFRRRYGLENKFIFLFPGVLGPAQNLEFIIQVAKRIDDIKELCFLFVGDGIEKEKLQNLAKEYGLQNAEFRPFVPREDFPSLVKEVNVGLACLGMRNKTPAIPGKVVGFMASSVPVAAFLNKESDAHEIIREAGCGYSMLSDDTEKAEKLIRKIFNEKNKLASYGRYGYNYAVEHFSKKPSIAKLERLF